MSQAGLLGCAVAQMANQKKQTAHNMNMLQDAYSAMMQGRHGAAFIGIDWESGKGVILRETNIPAVSKRGGQ